MLIKNALIGLAGAVAGVILLVSVASGTAIYPTRAPTPTSYYYGDLDGDGAITTMDTNVLKNLLNGKAYSFGALQPDNSDQDWNTCDIDSDMACTTIDKNVYTNYLTGKQVDIDDKSWVISSPDLSGAIYTVYLFVPFNANVSSKGGTVGRAGVAVTATIHPIGDGFGSTTIGHMSGRLCDPNPDGDPDQPTIPNVDDQCALAITVTDWTDDGSGHSNYNPAVTPADGYTEGAPMITVDYYGKDYPYGLKVEGDAAGTIAIELAIQDDGLAVPAITTTIYTHFAGAVPPTNNPPTWQTTPTNVTITGGSVYNTTDGTAQDVDTGGQTLTCTNNGTTCGFTVTVSGSGNNPQNCNVQFTAPVPAQTCNLRVMATDNGTPAMSVGATISLTIRNHAPIWLTAPSNITITSGSTYNQTNGVATDTDTGQTLTCSEGANNCSGMTFTYVGSGEKPLNCTLAFTAAQPQICNLRLVGSDNYVPATTVGATISITIPNRKPVFSTAPSNFTITSGSVYSTVNGVLSDPDSGQTLTCSLSAVYYCSGITFTYTGAGAKPLNCTLAFTAAQPQVCNLRLVGSDNYAPAATVGRLLIITIPNRRPIFSTTPTNVTITSGSVYSAVNGAISDLDSGETLSCSPGTTSCSGMTFTYTGSGSSPGPVNCTLGFTASLPQTCNLRLVGSDNSSYWSTVGSTISITIPNRAPTWSTTPVATSCMASASCGQTANGVLTDPENGETLTCSKTATSCTGVVFTYSGSGTKPVTCNLTVNASSATPQTCNLRLQGADNGAPIATVGATIPITIGHPQITWATSPTVTGCASGSTCGPSVNGILTDQSSAPTLTCVAGSNSCAGVVFTYADTGHKPVYCRLTVNASTATPQNCSLRLTGTDSYTPAMTIGKTITVNISNQAPTWSTTPVATSCMAGASCGPTVNGVLTDPNFGQTLTCAAGSNSCSGVVFTYAGSGAKPLSCNLTIDATAATNQTCALRLTGADNGAPALTVGATILVTIGTNAAPTWTTAPGDTTCASGATCGPTANGVATDTDAGETLTCSTTSNSCSGIVFTYAGSGPKPVTCNLTVNATAAAPQNCNLRVQVADNAAGALTVGQTIAITISNQAPTWSTVPADTTCASGTSCGPTADGVATDADAGETLTCSAGSTSCAGVAFTYAGSSAKPVTCNLTVNATAAAPQNCNLRVQVADNGIGALTVGQTIAITISNQAPTWSTVPVATYCAFGTSCGSAVNGILTDPNAGQTLTCLAGSTSCAQIIFTYSGSGPKPTNCSLTVDASAAPPQICNLRLIGADNGAPSLTVGTTITISTTAAGYWTWMSGSNLKNQYGVNGTKGVPDPANIPGSRFRAVTWTDGTGNLWLFGGNGYPGVGYYGSDLNDLWRWDGLNWTWISGSNTVDNGGFYGTKGVPDPANVPGARNSAVSWIDPYGNFWLFGGSGRAGLYTGLLNDLWRWDGLNWTWMSGSNLINQISVYGAKGVPDPANVLGARDYAVSWADVSGNFWLFGGYGIDVSGSGGWFNDLWRWDGLNWTWISGSNVMDQYGVYGTRGVPDPANVPGARYGAVSWTDPSGDFWLFGGGGFAASGNKDPLNDLWRWDGLNWTWMSGSNVTDQHGVYGTKGVPDPLNIPGSRSMAVSWTDAAGNLWLFGGNGYDASGGPDRLNDLWRWDGTNWTWMGGSDLADQSGVYGTKGVPVPANVPGARESAVSWTDASGNLWLFGGSGYPESGERGYLNDLWRYNP